VDSETSKRSGQAGKSIEEMTSYAVSHPIRVEILTILNEGTYTPRQLAALIGKPLNKVANHIRELLDGGSIEVGDIKRRGNITGHYYRAVRSSTVSDEEMAAMTPQHRQTVYGFLIQRFMAETLASFWAGKLRNDPRSWVASDWLNLDAQGRQEMVEEQDRSWARMQEIEADSFNRVAKSGEETVSYVVGQVSFERARTAPKAPDSADAERGTQSD
jgi:DNA-binding transcriptional ArsR family regulator